MSTDYQAKRLTGPQPGLLSAVPLAPCAAIGGGARSLPAQEGEVAQTIAGLDAMTGTANPVSVRSA